MNYKIVYDKPAVKFLKKQPKDIEGMSISEAV